MYALVSVFDQKILNKLRKHSKKIGWESMTSADDDRREKQSKKRDEIICHPLYPMCEQLYKFFKNHSTE